MHDCRHVVGEGAANTQGRILMLAYPCAPAIDSVGHRGGGVKRALVHPARAIAHAMRYDNPLLAYAPKIDLAGASAVYSHGNCVSVPNTFAAVTSLD